MSKLGTHMIQSAQEALAYASGERTRGFAVHKPVDVKAIRTRLGLSQPAFAAASSASPLRATGASARAGCDRFESPRLPGSGVI